MTVQLNHTIIWCRDRQASAAYLCGLLGRPAARSFGPFLVVDMDNEMSVDFHDHPESEGDIQLQHYAFLVDDATFDSAFGRIEASSQDYWADPGRNEPGVINH